MLIFDRDLQSRISNTYITLLRARSGCRFGQQFCPSLGFIYCLLSIIFAIMLYVSLKTIPNYLAPYFVPTYCSDSNHLGGAVKVFFPDAE